MEKKYYETKEDRQSDIKSLAQDHRYTALLEYINEMLNIVSISPGNPDTVSNHGFLGYQVGRMDAYREIRDDLIAFTYKDESL